MLRPTARSGVWCSSLAATAFMLMMVSSWSTAITPSTMLDMTAANSRRWFSMVSMRRPSWSAMRFMASARAVISAESVSWARSSRSPAAKPSAPACRRARAWPSRRDNRKAVSPASRASASPAMAMRARAPFITSPRDDSAMEVRTTNGRPSPVSAAMAQ